MNEKDGSNRDVNEILFKKAMKTALTRIEICSNFIDLQSLKVTTHTELIKKKSFNCNFLV